MDDKGYDYEILQRCTYPVGSNIGPYYEADCDEPAIARVWWRDYDTDYMFVCTEHLELIKQQEEA